MIISNANVFFNKCYTIVIKKKSDNCHPSVRLFNFYALNLTPRRILFALISADAYIIFFL